jgi:hypothetical protein
MGSLPPPQVSPFTVPPRRQRSMTRRIVLAGIVVAVAAILLWSCGKGAYHNYRLSAAAVERFHQQLDQGDFETIYGEATDEFRRAGSREEQIKFLAMVHEKMGNSGKMSAKGFHINWQNGRLSVNQVYDTQFALGQAQEGFIWIIEQDQPRLQTYRINSSNLR